MIKRLFIALSLFFCLIPFSSAEPWWNDYTRWYTTVDPSVSNTVMYDETFGPEAPSDSSSNSSTSWWCTYNIDGDVNLWSFLTACKPKKVAWWSGEFSVDWWFKTTVNNWIKNISLVLWIVAVWALVYAWMLFQFSAWEDDKIKKAKDIFKWTTIWFLLLISASWIIYVVINLVYWLAS